METCTSSALRVWVRVRCWEPVLFFYNADKLHLGIPKEMKSFDDFYLPTPNSYIVYEVEHEHRPFTVLVFRSSGRACYRFIDAPFERKWLVDEFGDVTSEYKVINSRLDKNIYMSKLIDRYEMFKEIIYGNYKVAGKEFGNFQLMEAKSYRTSTVRYRMYSSTQGWMPTSSRIS